ncbi:PolC-type DNA polymerase III [Deferribacter abyssi]|uniref:3'-5' exonuclease n=1 Tax=Deferribacter abyssi TaxID=213806 RepID=UPI003C22F130
MILEKSDLLDSRIDELEYCVFDIETTGVRPFDGDRIVEIGAVKIKPGLKVDYKNKFHLLVNPGMHIPDNSVSIHGITDKDVENAPDECLAFYKFLEYARGCILVAHNAKKDMNFLKCIMKDYSISNPFDFVIDTLTLSRKINIYNRYHNLDALMEQYNVKLNSPYKRHRALFDAELTSVVFRLMLKKLLAKRMFTLMELLIYLEDRN